MNITTWNINGIRAIMRKGFLDYLEKESPDILCLQETKISQKDIEKNNFEFPGYSAVWNPAERPGYSGTAILMKKQFPVTTGFGKEEFDSEGRVQTLETEEFFLVNVYFPNSSDQLKRLLYKLEFNKSLLKYLKKLKKKKGVIICGDFNVAHEEIDLARPKANIGSPGFTYEERAWMTKLLKNGFVDIFRYLHPKKVQYTWWSYRANARKRNVGWRIDYFCVSANILKKVEKISISDNEEGSDHCPVKIKI